MSHPLQRAGSDPLIVVVEIPHDHWVEPIDDLNKT